MEGIASPLVPSWTQTAITDRIQPPGPRSRSGPATGQPGVFTASGQTLAGIAGPRGHREAVMAAKPSPRNHRNNPYVLDGFAAQLHTSAAGSLWRLRSEVTVLAVLGGAYFGLYRALSGSFISAAVVLAVIVTAVLWRLRRAGSLPGGPGA